MEFSDYDGPFSAELAEAWPTLTEDQQYEIQAEANAAAEVFFLMAMFGDVQAAGDLAREVVREAHRIAGLPNPDVALVRDGSGGAMAL